MKLPLCGLRWEPLLSLALPIWCPTATHGLTFGSPPRCLASCLRPMGFGFTTDELIIIGLKYCLYFSDILRGLFSIHCQLHLASVHGPKDEIQSEPFQDAPPGE